MFNHSDMITQPYHPNKRLQAARAEIAENNKNNLLEWGEIVFKYLTTPNAYLIIDYGEGTFI